jgi:predicted nucleotidyltransferase
MKPTKTISELLARSSLGEATARALRARTPNKLAEIIAEAAGTAAPGRVVLGLRRHMSSDNRTRSVAGAAVPPRQERSMPHSHTFVQVSAGQSPAARFSALIRHLQPTSTELSAYAQHRRTLETRLHQHFGGPRLEVIGSHSRGTAISGVSDVDVLVRVPREVATWGGTLKSSKTVLEHVRSTLLDRYTRTDIRRDGQAVVVNFAGGSRSIDVVPAVFMQMLVGQNGIRRRPLFRIPNGDGGWLLTSPQVHNAFIDAADSRSRGKLKYAVQLLKFWRHCRRPNVPALSFHFDMLLAASRITEGAKSYQVILLEFFDILRRRDCRALQDPMGVSGYIPATHTETQRQTLLEAATTAYERSAKAISEEAHGRPEEAAYYWNLIFNDCFPKRG